MVRSQSELLIRAWFFGEKFVWFQSHIDLWVFSLVAFLESVRVSMNLKDFLVMKMSFYLNLSGKLCISFCSFYFAFIEFFGYQVDNVRKAVCFVQRHENLNFTFAGFENRQKSVRAFDSGLIISRKIWVILESYLPLSFCFGERDLRTIEKWSEAILSF